MQPNNFNHTEHAFVLSSLQEVVKVWSRGFGQASFDINVTDSVAELKLGFKLGRPHESHVHFPPDSRNQQHHQYDLDKDQVQENVFDHRSKRQKTAARKERDRARAEKYKATKQQNKQRSASDLVLPFSGNLLPVRPTQATTAVPAEAACEELIEVDSVGQVSD